MNDKNLIICGFMGCGKTTTGKILAKMTKREFFDMDIYIRKKHGMKIKKIFETYGEDYFRDIEYEAVKELCTGSGKVIALGGGTLLFERNYEVIKQNGTIIYISTPEENLIQRLKSDKKRPLLQNGDKIETIHNLYEQRTPLYKSMANVIVDGSGQSSEIAKTILILLR